MSWLEELQEWLDNLSDEDANELYNQDFRSIAIGYLIAKGATVNNAVRLEGLVKY